MKPKLMKTNQWRASLLCATIAALAVGCVEHRVEYVPVYQGQPGVPPQPGYTYQPQSAYTPPPGTVPMDTNSTLAPPIVPEGATAPMAQVAPPAPPVEIVTATPGPDYYWVPGYWTWNGGAWIWVSGRWTIRPWHGAVWIGGRWARHAHGWIWIGGRWR
jgi:hypothetical protein